MRRFPALGVLALAAAATGCIYERDVVRDDDRRVESPPAPAEAPSYTYDSGYDRYQADAPRPRPDPTSPARRSSMSGFRPTGTGLS